MSRIVTEQDFRMPEFKNAKVEDYEFRHDGKLVRKDRWETAIHDIKNLLDMPNRDFEISEVVACVQELVKRNDTWIQYYEGYDELPLPEQLVDVLLQDGSILHNAQFIHSRREWEWQGTTLPLPVLSWRIP